jgi:hypothetical protein
MDPTPTAVPDVASRSPVTAGIPIMDSDPFAVAIANASLLGAGYVMLGRIRLAVGTAAVTEVLIIVLALVEPPAWPWRVALLLWWIAMTVHGWYLAGGGRGYPEPGTLGSSVDLLADRPGRVTAQRYAAVGLTGAVLLAVWGLRVDAWRIEEDAAEAHRMGDCTTALSVSDGLGPGHRVAYGSLTARARDGEEACELLVSAERQARDDRPLAAETLETYRNHPASLWEGAGQRQADLLLAQAADELESAIAGNLGSLTGGFAHMSTVLDRVAGQEEQVNLVLSVFLGSLPATDPCIAKGITDWLADRPATDDVLDRSFDVVRQVAPTAMLRCGNEFLDVEQCNRRGASTVSCSTSTRITTSPARRGSGSGRRNSGSSWRMCARSSATSPRASRPTATSRRDTAARTRTGAAGRTARCCSATTRAATCSPLPG